MLYKQLIMKLEEDILNDYRPNDRFLSQREIMARYGCSYSTVEHALRELVASGILVRHHGKGTFVCERKPYGNGGQKLAIVMSENVLYGPRYFYADVLLSLTEELSSEGYSFSFLYAAADTPGAGSMAGRLTADGAFRGAFLVGVIAEALIETLREKRFPIVLVDRDGAAEAVPFVATANREGAYAAVVHLLAGTGGAPVGFISTPLHTSFLERYEGYCNALADHGRRIDRRLVNTRLRLERIDEDLEAFLRDYPRPGALFAANDTLAAHAARAARRLGLRVPEDLSLMGFDGDHAGECCVPPLTTMKVDRARMGKVAAELMRQTLAGRETEPALLETELIARASVMSDKEKGHVG